LRKRHGANRERIYSGCGPDARYDFHAQKRRGKAGGKMSADSMRRVAAILVVIVAGVAPWWAGSGAPASASANDAMAATIAAARERAAANNPRLKGSWRFEEGGWIYVHLEGEPGAMGYQHGYLLAPEI